MFTAVPILLTLLLVAGSTLPNGIHVDGIPADGSMFEVVAGYRAGVRNETSGASGLAATTAAFLASTPSYRAMAAAAYGAGGEIEFFSDLDRTGFRLKLPGWARPMVEGPIADFFSEIPEKNPALAGYALASTIARGGPLDDDFRSRVEDEIRIALLGTHPYDHRPSGWKQDLGRISPNDITQFFKENYGTDRAFVLITGSPADNLAKVAARTSEEPKRSINLALKAERTLRFQPESAAGAVVLGSPVPSVYYRGWYAVLLLDRLIQHVLPGKPSTSIVPALDPYYYRIEVPVPPGQFADAVQATLLQDLERMQFVRATERDLDAARQNALDYLNSESVRNWFLTMGIPDRQNEGIEWVRSFSADDIRTTARDLIVSNRVFASWDPKPKQVTVSEESLSSLAPSVPAVPPVTGPELSAVRAIPFPAHADPPFVSQAPERMASGISIVPSSRYAIFVAPNLLKVFDEAPTLEVIQSYAVYRPDRILIMAPASAMERVKQQWAPFRGNARDLSQASLQGKVTSGDLSVLLVLKMMLDRKLIESGLWDDVQLDVRAAEGSTLAIHASESNRNRVLAWIRDIGAKAPSDADLAWAREAAIHRLDRFLPDLQSLIWQWDPEGTIRDLQTISAEQIRDVAKLYDF